MTLSWGDLASLAPVPALTRVTNRAGAPATSIHVYSPPLSAMRFYELAPGRAPAPVRVERILDQDAVDLQGEILR